MSQNMTDNLGINWTSECAVCKVGGQGVMFDIFQYFSLAQRIGRIVQTQVQRDEVGSRFLCKTCMERLVIIEKFEDIRQEFVAGFMSNCKTTLKTDKQCKVDVATLPDEDCMIITPDIEKLPGNLVSPQTNRCTQKMVVGMKIRRSKRPIREAVSNVSSLPPTMDQGSPSFVKLLLTKPEPTQRQPGPVVELSKLETSEKVDACLAAYRKILPKSDSRLKSAGESFVIPEESNQTDSNTQLGAQFIIRPSIMDETPTLETSLMLTPSQPLRIMDVRSEEVCIDSGLANVSWPAPRASLKTERVIDYFDEVTKTFKKHKTEDVDCKLVDDASWSTPKAYLKTEQTIDYFDEVTKTFKKRQSENVSCTLDASVPKSVDSYFVAATIQEIGSPAELDASNEMGVHGEEYRHIKVEDEEELPIKLAEEANHLQPNRIQVKLEELCEQQQEFVDLTLDEEHLTIKMEQPDTANASLADQLLSFDSIMDDPCNAAMSMFANNKDMLENVVESFLNIDAPKLQRPTRPSPSRQLPLLQPKPDNSTGMMSVAKIPHAMSSLDRRGNTQSPQQSTGQSSQPQQTPGHLLILQRQGGRTPRQLIVRNRGEIKPLQIRPKQAIAPQPLQNVQFLMDPAPAVSSPATFQPTNQPAVMGYPLSMFNATPSLVQHQQQTPAVESSGQIVPQVVLVGGIPTLAYITPQYSQATTIIGGLPGTGGICMHPFNMPTTATQSISTQSSLKVAILPYKKAGRQ